MMWRPIETAPRDGTIIDLWAEERRWADRRWGQHDPFSKVPFGPEHWISISDEKGWRRYIEPTHWMPLPTGPGVLDPTTPLLARMAEALKAMQIEARARNCGLKIADDVLAEYAAMTGENGDG